eukprot:1987298-Pyramimonas_sp.AAC.1
MNVEGGNGYTPLHWAAANGRKEAVQALVELGANSILKDANGRTPIVHMTANYGQHAGVKYSRRRSPPKQQRTDVDPTAQAAAAALAEAMANALIAEEEDQKQAAASTSSAGKPRARKKPNKSRGKASAEAGASGADRT